MAREKDVMKSFNWRLTSRVAGWLLLGLSTVWAGRTVKRTVLDDQRFIIAGTFAESEDTPDFMVHGLNHTPRERVVRVFAGDFGRNVFLIPLHERRRRLLAIDWVRDATVARVWPNRVVVRIKERTPVAFVYATRDPAHPQMVRLALIDGEGVILQQPRKANFSFPIVRGVYERQTETDRRDRIRLMQRLTEDLGPLAKNVSEIDVSSPDLKLTVEVSGRTVELWIGNRNFASRMRNFLDHYQEIRRRSETAAVFDLRLDDRITARE